MAILQRPRYAVVGLLEMLFHFVADFCPQGDIGRYSDAVIAGAVEWEGAPELLMEALVGRWLDVHPVHRLVLHDWEDHAPDYIRKKLRRTGQWFAVGGSSNVQSSDTDRSATSSTQPNPAQPNPAQPAAAAALPPPQQQQPTDDGQLVDRFPAASAAVREAFPATGPEKISQILAAVVSTAPDAEDEEIAAAVPRARFPRQESAAGFRRSLPTAVVNLRKEFDRRRSEIARSNARDRADPDPEAEFRRIIADGSSSESDVAWARRSLEMLAPLGATG